MSFGPLKCAKRRSAETLLISSSRVIWGNVAYVQEAPDSGGLHTHAQKKKQLRVFFKFEDLLNCQDI